MKKKVLQQAGGMVKDFRHNLKALAFDKEGNPNYEPPSDTYSFIDQDTWRELVDRRLTPEFVVS